MSGGDLISQIANLYWYHHFAKSDQGREPWLSTLRGKHLDPYHDWCWYNAVPEGYLGYSVDTEEDSFGTTGYIRGAQGRPWGSYDRALKSRERVLTYDVGDKAAAERVTQKVAQDRMEAESAEALRTLIGSYSHGGAPARSRNTTTAPDVPHNNSYPYSSSSRNTTTAPEASRNSSYPYSSSARTTATALQGSWSSNGGDSSPQVMSTIASSPKSHGVQQPLSAKTPTRPRPTGSSLPASHPLIITAASATPAICTITTATANNQQASGQGVSQDKSSHPAHPTDQVSSPAQENDGAPWSPWIWSSEYGRYYAQRTDAAGKVEYTWA